jgi:hypothetical protein
VSRRIVSVLVAGLMIFSLLPATAAFAQANATARLTGNQVVFPGDTSYTIEVRNTEPQLIGRSINAVEIYLPVVGSGVVLRGTPPAQGGFTAQGVDGGATQFVTYRGGSIAPQSTATFTIPVTVRRPARSDLASDFIVKVSSNNLSSSQNAQPTSASALTAAVEVLEILPNSVRPVAPTNADNSKGVTDGSGTGGAAGQNGQTIQYAFDVRNHAREAINVTGSLGANNSVDRPGAAVTKSVAPEGGQATYTVPVTLGPAPTGDRNVQFIAEAVGPRADAAPKTNAFTVQQPVDLDFTGLNPTRVRSGVGSAREFNVTAAKSGGPSFELTSGALRFGSNTATLKDTPMTFQSGSRSSNMTYQISEISGGDGQLNASITSVGSDDNLANYSLSEGVGLIIIDNIVPTLQLDLPVLGTNGNDADGDELVAATNGTRITVNGKAFGTDLNAGSLKVALRPDSGDEIPVNVSRTQEEDGIRFTGNVSPNWANAATRFTVVAEIADDATNVGYGQSGFTLIDQVLPVLDPDSGVVQSSTEIRVQFDDATGLRGACDPRSWRIDSTPNRVVEVRTSAGVVCSGSSAEAVAARRALSTDGVRILTLNYELGFDATPPVTYTPGVSAAVSRQLGIYLAKDGARNTAIEQTISTVTDLVPPAPDVQDIRRRDHESNQLERAEFDEGRYYTNNGGAQAIRASITGVRENYTIQVVDGSGKVLHEEAARRPSLLTLASEWTQDIDIPLGTTDGNYTRGVRLLSSVGNVSLPTQTLFVIDTVAPRIGSSVLTAPDEVMLYFSEKIVDDTGAENGQDWFAAWMMQGEDQAQLVRTRVKTFNYVDATSRRIGLDFEVTPQNFRHIDYWRQQQSSRYQDRAGNYLLDTWDPTIVG